MRAFVNCELNGADLPSASYDVFPDVTKPLPEPAEIFNNYERQRRKRTLSSCEVSIVLSLTSSLVSPLVVGRDHHHYKMTLFFPASLF